MSAVIKTVARFLPSGIKLRIRSSGIYNRIVARKLASTDKRLDVCAAQVAHVLHLSGFSGKLPLRGKVCLELGSGWVLSHALVFHLLEAKRVLATDTQAMAYPPCVASIAPQLHNLGDSRHSIAVRGTDCTGQTLGRVVG